MQVETTFIAFLFSIIALLMNGHKKHLERQKKREQHDKVVLSLLSYPVHQYTMAHMLERCLAIIFAASEGLFLPKGAIFLQENDECRLAVQRGIFNGNLSARLTWPETLFGTHGNLDTFQFIAATAANPGYCIIPLRTHDHLLGTLVLYINVAHKFCDADTRYTKSLGKNLSSLVERKQIADELRLCNRVVDFSQHAILITDRNNRIIRCNKACEKISGYEARELIGQNPGIFKSGRHDERFYRSMWKDINEQGFWQGEVWNKSKNGMVFPEWLTISGIKDADEENSHYLAIFTDLSQIKKAEEDIHQLAFYDPLTHLPNRTLFNDHLQQSIAQAEKRSEQFALLCLDIDNFKNINDSLGHDSGDTLLQVIAGRIEKILDGDDFIARMGGDEFAILIQDLNSKNSGKVLGIAGKILESISKAVQLDGHEFIATASIGISYYPEDAGNAVDLIKYADTAMFQAKQSGRNSYQFYTEKFNRQAVRKIQLESGLRQALKQNDFIVFLQPQLALDSQQMIGAEALLRVGRGQLQDVSPAEYIPVAEEIGLIVEIGDWVFAEVCRLLRQWHDTDMIPDGFKRVAVNISPLQFKRHDFVSKISRCIQSSGVPVKYLEIELTESSLQESDATVSSKLFAIKEMGINIAIDDFGTGYSSLSRLKQFPIDLLKIDRSFVNDLTCSQSDMAIVKAIVNMARAINIKTLAEGVETETQADILRTLHCDYSQGFLHSRPLNSRHFAEKLAEACGHDKTVSGQAI